MGHWTTSRATYAFGKLVCFAITIALHSESAWAVPRNVVASHLAASSRQVAFSVQEEKSVGLVIADLKSGAVTELKSPGNLVFPYLSPDGSRLLVVRQHAANGTSDLLSCTTDTFRCKQLHTSKGSISNPIEIDEHRILFILSQSRNDSCSRHSIINQCRLVHGIDVIGILLRAGRCESAERIHARERQVGRGFRTT